jgi:hypothetical protein
MGIKTAHEGARAIQEINKAFLKDVFGYRSEIPRRVLPFQGNETIVLFNPEIFSFCSLFNLYESFSFGKAVRSGHCNCVDEELFEYAIKNEYAMANIDSRIGYNGGYYFAVHRSNEHEETILRGAQQNPKGLVGQMKHDSLCTVTIAEALLFDLFVRWSDEHCWSGIPNTSILTATTVFLDVFRESTGGQYRENEEGDLLDSDVDDVVSTPLLLSFDSELLSGRCQVLVPQEHMIFKKVFFRM